MRRQDGKDHTARRLDAGGLGAETTTLDDFYDYIQKLIGGIDNADGRQRVITGLYEEFFGRAMPSASTALGIVYTPRSAACGLRPPSSAGAGRDQSKGIQVGLQLECLSNVCRFGPSQDGSAAHCQVRPQSVGLGTEEPKKALGAFVDSQRLPCHRIVDDVACNDRLFVTLEPLVN